MTQQEKARFTLLGGRVALRQPERGYRVAIDPVFLAAAIIAAEGARVLDVGCGVGAASMCLASRVAGCTVQGIDSDSDVVDLACENARANGIQDRVRFSRLDVGDGVPADLAGRFDQVMSNPPYLPPERADLRGLPDAARRANVESLPLVEWVAFMAGCARPGGTLTLIHRADRIEAVLGALAAVAGGLTLVPLWPRSGASARRVIVSGIKGGNAPTTLHPGLCLHEADGTYTRRAKQILVDGGSMPGVPAGISAIAEDC